MIMEEGLEDIIKELRAEIDALKAPAKFGMQCYQDRCENAYVEYSVLKKVEARIEKLRHALICETPKGRERALEADDEAAR